MRLLTGLASKLHAKLALMALHHNCLSAQHCTRLLEQVEDRYMTGSQAFRERSVRL